MTVTNPPWDLLCRTTNHMKIKVLDTSGQKYKKIFSNQMFLKIVLKF